MPVVATDQHYAGCLEQGSIDLQQQAEISFSPVSVIFCQKSLSPLFEYLTEVLSRTGIVPYEAFDRH